MRHSILLIYTGGTIGMIEDPVSGALQPFNFEELVKNVPELKAFDLELQSVSFDPLVDSSNLGVDEWQQIVHTIESNYHAYDGFVVLHGTDTMAYTASALSFMLPGLKKPVILTGSQLPIGVPRTDGKENLITAIQLASMVKNNEAMIQEVAVYFGSALYRGNRTHKFSTENFDAIVSPNMLPLVEAGIHLNFRHELLFRPKNTMRFAPQYSLEQKVAVLRLFPGMTPDYVEAICNIKGLKGLVIQTFGSGNAPSDSAFVKALRGARDNGVQMVNITQCNQGFVEQGRYATSHQLRDLGIVSGADMTFEAGMTKMMFVLPRIQGESQFEKQMLNSLRGELTNFSSLV